MMSRPSTQRLIEVIRQELGDNIAPKLADDGSALASLQMVDHVLETLARRAAHEVAWMTEEIQALQALGEHVVAAMGSNCRTAEAVAALQAVDSASLHVDDVAERYSLASEILSCAIEELPEDSPIRGQAEAALDARLAREVSIIGEFQLVGRS
jgi:flagellar biosynthesis component FlhA